MGGGTVLCLDSFLNKLVRKSGGDLYSVLSPAANDGPTRRRRRKRVVLYSVSPCTQEACGGGRKGIEGCSLGVLHFIDFLCLNANLRQAPPKSFSDGGQDWYF